ncbi:leucyl aminopeptidase [Candidatus Peregrinibacteria bacterium CG11_big_fil_rev_8_21_14_0_20_41_10]|nr:MAG: leucyl aminopeptidase [Candidatus Peregrinibacteria bacterium CG11_big_fil_rev_8_21_14_0_20_41_10]PIZ77361.1 MAG: leucyl aminopeptidase [Candidatus Peregrinibacteria bacterium CG_4_10_14_0_2_um_filter_41_8]PJC37867.1 MAG: leucyl aminopeptidase [Candidatus Peregrinibacteria bacterium CG_4_9_14_0_2_um_filter_41_14]
MKLNLLKTYTTADAILLPLFENKLKDAIDQLPATLQKQIAHLVDHKVTGKRGDIEVFHTATGKTNVSIYFIGLGEKAKLDSEQQKLMGAKTAQAIKKYKYDKVAIFPINKKENIKIMHFFALGFLLGSYKFDTYINDKKKKQHIYKEIQVISPDSKLTNTEFDELNTITQAIYYTRDLVNTPPNELTPTQLGKEALAIGKLSRQIKVTIFDDKLLKKHKMGLILGVGAGSHEESRLIFMEYKNKPTNKKPLLIVGKGVTFDAGGLNIKPTNNIEDMKSDMAGAASVLGLMQILAKLKPNLHVVGVISSAENLLGDKAMKPGDILTAYNGETVEITNTDAEGRLVLADALAYSTKKYNPEIIVDIATLTGACIAAIGFQITGVVSNNDKLYNKLETASKNCADLIWHLPLTQHFQDKVASDIADYKNWTAGVNAGASMGAAFLEKFINNHNWAHLDIAGSSWTPENTPTSHQGATGVPVHMLWELIKQY